MNSILDELFMGRIDILENLPFRKQEPVPDEAAFIKTLTTEQQQLYEEIQDSFMERCALEYKDCFVTGFKMAIRIILESL